TSITVTPNNITVPANGQQQFTATGLDQHGNPMSPQPAFIWSASGGGTFSTGLLADGSFEAGMGPWTTYNTPANLSNTNVHSGTTGVTLNANSGFFQQLSGLTPGATYILTGWARVQTSGDTVWLGVKNYGGTEVFVPITSTSYTHGAVAFTMPAGYTTAL